jgi:hypothetical protein
MPPRIDHPVDTLLPDWGAWVRKENRTGLGYSQVQYAEMIARSTSASGWNPHVDLDVTRLDELIRKELPPHGITVLVLRYVQMLPDKRAAVLMRLSRSELSKLRSMFVMPALRQAWDRIMCVQNID